MKSDVPVLLIIWRRPETLRKVIGALRAVKPTRIFVAGDGPSPSRPREVEQVAQARSLIDSMIDWPCKIERFFSETNQGCRRAVEGAIDWFFQNVEEGIILEDDCVPHPDFFAFCGQLLDHYRQDLRVGCITGNNFQGGSGGGARATISPNIPIAGDGPHGDGDGGNTPPALIFGPNGVDPEHGRNVFPSERSVAFGPICSTKVTRGRKTFGITDGQPPLTTKGF